jgi:hypothetical protein
MKGIAHFLILFLLILSPTFGQTGQSATKNAAVTTPTLVWNTACASTNAMGSGFSGTPDYRCPFPEPAISGNTIILALGYDNTGNNQSITVTDDKSDTVTLDVTSPSSPNHAQVRLYRISNVTAGASYINVHLSSGSTTGYFLPAIAEFYNVTTTSPVDATSCGAGSTATITAGSLGILSTSGDLIYQFSYSDQGIFSTNFSANTSFAAGSQANITWALNFQLLGDSAAGQHGVYNSTAALTPMMTQGTALTYISCAIALKPGSSGSDSSAYAHIVHLEHDAMWNTRPNPWSVGMVSTGDAIYVSRVGNDPVTSITSSPVPDLVNWTPSGSDFTGLNGHNHTNLWCAKFSSPPGPLTISITRSGGTADDIKLVYDVKGGTCNLDVDSGGQAANQGSIVSSMTVCSGCLTPTHQNDIIFSLGGQGFCTVTSFASPIQEDNDWFSGNNVNGSTNTDENNGWGHYYNGASLSPVSVTWGEACGSTAEGNWAGRVAAYQSVSTGAPQPPTGLSAIVH